MRDEKPECRGVNQKGRSQCLQHFEDYAVRWEDRLVYRRKSFGTYGVLQMTYCTVDCEMQPSDLLDDKLGFVSENTFSCPLGFLLQRKRVFFQTCCFFKQ